MQNPYKNVCYRCGKERIVLRVWTEKIDNSTIENTISVCPDKICQEAMDEDNLKQRNKRLLMEQKRNAFRRKKVK